MIHEYDIAIIGGGPAGICAALAAGKNGLKTLLIEERNFLGGQLIKQTHRFFGSEQEHAGTRGITIVDELKEELTESKNVDIMDSTTALGYYEDGILTALHEDKMIKIKPKSMVIATGAFERFLPFENNDLPGIFGAGAVQTLMNIYGIKPAQKVLMIGSGNIGLIVSYQLIQAGVEVVALVEAASKIGGYLVHASKLRRLGVPILTRHTIKRALGKDKVEGALVCQLDQDWKEIEGTQRTIECDSICLAVGLTPLSDILSQMGCETTFVGELGGIVPKRTADLETTKPGVFVAGDLSGIEEATAAMLEGELAGLNAVKYVNADQRVNSRIEHLKDELRALRAGPVGEKIRYGLAQLYEDSVITKEKIKRHEHDITQLAHTGIASEETVKEKTPHESRLSKPYALIECFQEIPCNPCVASCPFDAIFIPKEDINASPIVDFDKCTGCGSCISCCPGLAIFVEDLSLSNGKGTLTLAFEMLDKPEKGESVALLGRDGGQIGIGKVIRILNGKKQDKTAVITVQMDRQQVRKVRNIRPIEKNLKGGEAYERR